jgi:hypothetical protein
MAEILKDRREEPMGRVSTKANKNVYQLSREKLGLSREKASALLEIISDDRIEKIESEKSLPHPDEVLLMAEKYKAPELCNYYCSHECPIGLESVPEVKIKDLSQIVLEMLASLNRMNAQKDRLVEITVDGRIDDDELQDFAAIQDNLDKISMTIDALQLWSKQMIAKGLIDKEKMEAFRK